MDAFLKILLLVLKIVFAIVLVNILLFLIGWLIGFIRTIWANRHNIKAAFKARRTHRKEQGKVVNATSRITKTTFVNRNYNI